MAGFQIPQTNEGEIRRKRQIGRIWSETDLLNIFSIRMPGNFIEAASGWDRPESNLAFGQEIEIYLAGTLTQEVSYFLNLVRESRQIVGSGTQMREESGFDLGKEFFLMINLQSFLSGGHGGLHGTDRMIHGPMIMVGKIDPSTNFSYPTNRQMIGNFPGQIESSAIRRFTLTPYAFGVKFFGITTGQKNAIEVTRGALYNTSGDLGLDVHAMAGPWFIQAGLMQGLFEDAADVNQKKDPYLMVRMNFGGERYQSGSVSGLAYRGNDTARVEGALVDWMRYGVAANIRRRHLDLYGAVIWDRLINLPNVSDFDKTALGATVEGDYLISDRWMISARYDQMNAGGPIQQKADGKVVSLQARFYPRENLSFFLRDSVNVEAVTQNPLQNFRHLTAVGIDLVF